jgi:hypothetical protein
MRTVPLRIDPVAWSQSTSGHASDLTGSSLAAPGWRGPEEEGNEVTTADIVMERAFDLADAGTDTEEAVAELLAASGDRRVAVVMARRHLLEQAGEEPDTRATRAIELLDGVLLRLPEA